MDSQIEKSRLYRSRRRQRLSKLPKDSHAGNELREAFDAMVTGLDTHDAPEAIQIDGITISSKELCGLLWNCTDQLPNSLYQEIKSRLPDDIKVPTSFAGAARLIKRYLTNNQVQEQGQ